MTAASSSLHTAYLNTDNCLYLSANANEVLQANVLPHTSCVCALAFTTVCTQQRSSNEVLLASVLPQTSHKKPETNFTRALTIPFVCTYCHTIHNGRQAYPDLYMYILVILRRNLFHLSHFSCNSPQFIILSNILFDTKLLLHTLQLKLYAPRCSFL